MALYCTSQYTSRRAWNVLTFAVTIGKATCDAFQYAKWSMNLLRYHYFIIAMGDVSCCCSMLVSFGIE